MKILAAGYGQHEIKATVFCARLAKSTGFSFTVSVLVLAAALAAINASEINGQLAINCTFAGSWRDLCGGGGKSIPVTDPY